MAGFGVLIVSGILSAIFLFFIAVFAAAAAYIMASYVLEGFSIACMRKKAGDAHTFPAWIPFTASICWENWQTGGSWAPCRPF